LAQDRRHDSAPAASPEADEALHPRLAPGKRSLAELLGTRRHPPPLSPGKVTLSDALPYQPADAEHSTESRAPEEAAVADAAAASSGDPLADHVRGELERSLGVDLGGVRVHTDPAAAAAATAIGARAYTVGQHIYFASGQYNPGGDELLAHEVAHTVQQRGGSPELQPKLEMSSSGDALEVEADRAADAFMRGERATVTAAASGGAQVFRWQTASGTPRQEHVISPDGFLIQGPNIQVERVWYEQQYERNRVSEMRKILRALAAHEMPWINDLSDTELSSAASNIRLRVNFDEGHDLATVPIRNTVTIWVGLPPGTNARWDFPAAKRSADAAAGAPRQREAVLYIRSSELLPADAGRQFSPALMTEIADRLEAAVGASMMPGIRDEGIAVGNLLPPGRRPPVKTFALPHTRDVMVRLFGEGAWSAYELRSDAEGAVATGSEQTGGVSVAPGVSNADADFVRRMLEEINGAGGQAASGPSLRVDSALVAALREIDGHPKRAEIIAALQSSSGGAPPNPEETAADRFRRVMYAVDMQEEYARLGVTADGDSRNRAFDWPVEARIVNHTDLLFTGKKAEFSIDILSMQFQPVMVTVPWVHVTWIVREPAASRQVDRDWTRHLHRQEQPEHYEITFDNVGTYEINALVDHDDFLPNHFSILVEVKTEDERFRELEGRTYNSGMWGEVDPNSIEHGHEFYGTSATDTHDEGTRYEGVMPATCEPGTPMPGAQLQQQIANVRAFMESGRANADEMRWASEYLEQMEGTQRQIEQRMANGQAQQLFVQGVYLARSGDAKSQELALVALAKQEGSDWRVEIFDTTQAFDSRNSHFSETGSTFRSAAEQTFTELCKSYPRGQMSLRMEILDDNGASTGRFIGFELDCDSTWEAVRRTVWNPVTQVVVNIAGAVVAIFLPFTAPVIVPTLIAYNAVDTVATMVDLGARDALTFEDVMIGLGQIAIDVIPYIGQATKLVKIGTTVYHLFEGLQLAGEAVLLSAQMTEEVQNIRFGVMRQAAEVHAQIQTLEQTNPSDPSLPALRQQFEDLRQQAATAWETVLVQTGSQIAVMRASMHVVHGIHAHQQGLDAAARSHVDDAVRTRGRQPIQADDLPHLERTLGVRVETTGTDGDVMIRYEVGALGGITDVHIVVGPNANLRMLMQHEATLHAMQRYAGVTGSVRTLLERIEAFRAGGGRIPPGSRAFEAQFELQKLPPIIESMRAELTGHPIGSHTRDRIEAQIASLEEQLYLHGQGLDDLTPGLGYVAARDGSPDPNATMGHAPPHGAAAPQQAGSRAWPTPAGRSERDHARRVRERGSGTVPHDGTPPTNWTGAREAAFRYGDDVARSVPDGYHWSTDANGAPTIVRDREIGSDGQPVPRRYFSQTPVDENGTTTHFPLMSDDVTRARFQTDHAGVITEQHNLSPQEQRTARDIVKDRNAAIRRRDTADRSLAGLRSELGLSEDDLGSTRFQDTLDRLRREHAGDQEALAKIDELERQRTALASARDDVVAASERLGNRMAVDYIRSQYPTAQLLYGDPDGRGRPGEFDFVYFVPGTIPMRDQIIVVEAKGGSSSLGTRRVNGAEAQQGTLPYMQEIARVMRDSTDDPRLSRALEAMEAGDPNSGPLVRYLLVEAPLDASGSPRPGRVREFDISS
jgi:hypothetical protein